MSVLHGCKCTFKRKKVLVILDVKHNGKNRSFNTRKMVFGRSQTQNGVLGGFLKVFENLACIKNSWA